MAGYSETDFLLLRLLLARKVKTLVVNNLILQRDILSRNLFLLFLVVEHREIQWMVLPAFKLMWKAFTEIVFALKPCFYKTLHASFAMLKNRNRKCQMLIARAEGRTQTIWNDERCIVLFYLVRMLYVWFLQLNCFANQPAKQQPSTHLAARRTHFNAVF